jgi:hypothetical protein
MFLKPVRSACVALAFPGLLAVACLLAISAATLAAEPPGAGASDPELAEMQKKVEQVLKRGKGDYFAIGLSETTFHPGDAVKKTTFRPHPGGIVEERTDFPASQPGVVYPITSADFRVIEGYEAAVEAVLEHMRKYPPPPKRAGPRAKPPVGTPSPAGDWRLLGRFAGAAQAEKALQKARVTYDMLPKWQLKNRNPKQK